MSLGRIVIDLDLDGSRFTSGINRATGQIETFNLGVRRGGTSLRDYQANFEGAAHSAHRMVQTLGLAEQAVRALHRVTTEWILGIIKSNAALERTSVLLQGLSKAPTEQGKIREAADSMDFLINRAKTAPFSLNALSDSFVKLNAGGIQNAQRSMIALTDAVAKFGGSDEALKRASIAIQQMGGKGVISMEELRQQLGEAVPTAIQAMATGMGMSMRELTKKIATGSVEAQSALTRMTDEFDRQFRGAAARMMLTWDGMIANLSTSFLLWQQRVGDAGFFNAAKAQLQELIDLINSPMGNKFADQLGASLVWLIKNVRTFIEVLVENRRVLEDVGIALLAVWGMGKLAAIVGGLSALVGSIRAASAGFATLGAELRMIPTAMAMANFAGGANGLTAIGAAGGVAAVGIRGVGMAISMLAGPIGIAIAALFIMADAWDLFGRKSADAVLSAREGLEILGRQGIATAKATLAATDQAIAKLQDTIVKDKARVLALPGNREAQKMLSADLDALRQHMSDRLALSKQIADSENDIADRKVEKAARDLQKETEQAQTAAQARYVTVIAGMTDEINAANLTADQKIAIAKRIADEQTRFEDERVNIIRAHIATAEALLKTATAGQVTAIEKHITWLKTQLVSLSAVALQAIKNLNTPLPTGADPDKGKQDPDKWIQRTTVRLEGLKGTITGTGKELAELNAELAAGLYKDMTPAKEAQMRKLAAEQDRLNKARSDGKVGAQGLAAAERVLSREMDDSARKFAAALSAMSNPDKRGMSDGFMAEEKRLAEAMKNIRKGTAAYAQAKQDEATVLARFQATEIVEFVGGLDQRTKALTRALLTEREQKEQEYKDEIDRIMKMADLQKLPAAARMAAEQKLQAFLDARKAQFDRDMESPATKLLRDWQDKSKQMQEATAGWLRQSSELLTEFAMTGKLKLADFTESVLRDIIRIQTQASLAKIFGPEGIMGKVGSWLGGMLGSAFGTPTSGSGGKGGTMVAHGGGKVGHGGGTTRTVDPSVFDFARRYHGGGTVLGQNEVPIIAKRGETVLTEDQMAAKSGQQMPNVQVNVINQSGNQMNAEQKQPRFDGRQMILDVVLTAASTPGGFRDNMKSAMA